jgi:glycosyltransferase involved in cell wall biosynthesis
MENRAVRHASGSGHQTFVPLKTMTQPLVSILTPVFNPPRDSFIQCISSVLSQTFGNWEWCLVDDAADQSLVADLLADLADSDSRIKVFSRASNGGIVNASNDALNLARGEFVALLDHDDELHPQALEKIAECLHSAADIDYLYTDEDKIDQAGHHYDAFLKPDWSPERLRSQNYCCHLSVLRRSLVKDLGGFRSGFDGSQDYDLILRVTEIARRIVHVPEVLYHWRAVAGSTALSTDEKPYAFQAAIKAVSEHLHRVGVNGIAEDAGHGYLKVIRSLTEHPLVSIVIPTRGTRKFVRGKNAPLVTRFIDSILELSTYKKFEIIVVADTDTPDNVTDLLASRPNTRVVPYSKPFNFSEKCNLGALHANGDVLLLLNDDMEVISPNWLETLIGHLHEPDVGIVGPLLLLEDERIQSAGHSNTPTPHNFRNGSSSRESGEFGILAIAREVSGLTGAAMAVRRDVYFEAGGMSLAFGNCFNDVDFCFKVLDLGYRLIWTPHVRLFHYESVTRDARVSEAELNLLSQRWGRKFDNDTFCRLQ